MVESHTVPLGPWGTVHLGLRLEAGSGEVTAEGVPDKHLEVWGILGIL